MVRNIWGVIIIEHFPLPNKQYMCSKNKKYFAKEF